MTDKQLYQEMLDKVRFDLPLEVYRRCKGFMDQISSLPPLQGEHWIYNNEEGFDMKFDDVEINVWASSQSVFLCKDHKLIYSETFYSFDLSAFRLLLKELLFGEKIIIFGGKKCIKK